MVPGVTLLSREMYCTVYTVVQYSNNTILPGTTKSKDSLLLVVPGFTSITILTNSALLVLVRYQIEKQMNDSCTHTRDWKTICIESRLRVLFKPGKH